MPAPALFALLFCSHLLPALAELQASMLSAAQLMHSGCTACSAAEQCWAWHLCMDCTDHLQGSQRKRTLPSTLLSSFAKAADSELLAVEPALYTTHRSQSFRTLELPVPALCEADAGRFCTAAHSSDAEPHQA